MITLKSVEFMLGYAQKLPEMTTVPAAVATDALVLNISPSIAAAVDNARQEIAVFASQNTFQPVFFEDFGTTALKRAGMSPDAFVQMAFQLGYFRTFGRVVATYESCHTRKYLRGRTTCIRVASNQAAAFVRGMNNASYSAADKRKLLSEAITQHTKLARLALEGQDCDRPMLGWRLLAKERSIDLPPLFKEPVFARTCTWKLSTSQLSSPCFAVAFAAVVEDGYGIWYGLQDEQIRMTVTAGPKAAVEVSVLSRNIVLALREMFVLVSAADAQPLPRL
eukprot:TRINITY_DN4930_c0_g1_i13.p2 TRINITY_DN4930_c0_g1~~TRINITY_DN4930_c0_g1_i13.p2  ORF type:complete len:279 (+),score=69.24 TRINITY_DN4930_c0_g1_i13:1003-1839(+)